MSGQSFPSFGRCIFCKDSSAVRTREHIVPKAIGGNKTILDATCENCQRTIKPIEDHCHLTHLIGARRFLGLRGHTRASKQKTVLPLRATTMLGKGTLQIAAEDYPAIIAFPVFTDASWTQDIELRPEPASVAGFKTFVLDGRHDLLRAKYGILEFEGAMFGPGILARYLAKIAHCAAVAQYGIQGFDPFLPRLILSRPRDDDRLLPFLSNTPPLEVDGDHRLFSLSNASISTN